MSKTVVRECVCESAYQDTKYGKKKRVMNTTKSGDHRCTVCGKVHKGA